jgi:predicted metal-dependent hydrolase
MTHSTWANRDEFRHRVEHWANELDVDVRSITIRPMTRKWASCSTNGRLNFNDELLEMDRDLGDYVIVHELLHFSAPNHGRLWKMLMRAHLGEYEVAEQKLKAASLPRTRTP